MANRITAIDRSEVAPPSESNLPLKSENSAGASIEKRSGHAARSIDPGRETQPNMRRAFAPEASYPMMAKRASSPAPKAGSLPTAMDADVPFPKALRAGPKNVSTPNPGMRESKGVDWVDKNRPVGDQTGMPPGVVPRNRMLTEKELSENPLNTFVQDPSSFAASYFINTMRNFVMPGRTVPEARPGETVNGSDNIVGFTLNRVDGHNAEMTVTGMPSELGRPGTPSSSLAYYLPFTNGGATTIRVPRNPAADDPQFLVTGPFTGCSFYVREDPTDPNFLLFTHDPRRGLGTTTSPTGIPEGAVGMSYEASYGREHGMSPTQVPSASAFAYYDRTTKLWVMKVQHGVVEVPLNASGIPGVPEQRQRTPGRIEGEFIPVMFGNDRLPSIPRQDPNLPGPSNRNDSGDGTSFWAAFEAGAATGAVIGGAAGIETGPGAAVTAGIGALAGSAIAGFAWIFSWTQHSNSRP